MVYERVLSVFEHRQNIQFYSELTELYGAFLSKAVDKQIKIVKQILSWELKRLKTLNKIALKVAKDKAVEYLQKKRRNYLVKVQLDQEKERTGKQTTKLARIDKMVKVTDSQINLDSYSLEIKAMGVS